MPFKHQMASYRIRKGVRFECDGDICALDMDTSIGSLRRKAYARVAQLKAEGRKAFFESGDVGAYYRVFVEAKTPAVATGAPANV